MMTIKTFICNMLDENCYVVSAPNGECAIIDCGAFYDEERRRIAQYISDGQLTPKVLLSTHAHLDHNFGTPFVYDTYGLQPVYASEDRSLMARLPQQAASFYGLTLNETYPQGEQFLTDGDEINVGSLTFRVIATPGHSRGSVVFHCEEEGVVFTGDTLFSGSAGRTDLHGGSMMQLMQSMKRLAELPPETKVYPGHGPSTTIGRELTTNPFMQ